MAMPSAPAFRRIVPRVPTRHTFLYSSGACVTSTVQPCYR
jgi:hypothetical protein